VREPNVFAVFPQARAMIETALAVRNLPVLVGSPRDEVREAA
jgi:hypothetical protein